MQHGRQQPTADTLSLQSRIDPHEAEIPVRLAGMSSLKGPKTLDEHLGRIEIDCFDPSDRLALKQLFGLAEFPGTRGTPNCGRHQGPATSSDVDISERAIDRHQGAEERIHLRDRKRAETNGKRSGLP
jgi:hypothetical protein